MASQSSLLLLKSRDLAASPPSFHGMEKVHKPHIEPWLIILSVYFPKAVMTLEVPSIWLLLVWALAPCLAVPEMTLAKQCYFPAKSAHT